MAQAIDVVLQNTAVEKFILAVGALRYSFEEIIDNIHKNIRNGYTSKIKFNQTVDSRLNTITKTCEEFAEIAKITGGLEYNKELDEKENKTQDFLQLCEKILSALAAYELKCKNLKDKDKDKELTRLHERIKNIVQIVIDSQMLPVIGGPQKNQQITTAQTTQNTQPSSISTVSMPTTIYTDQFNDQSEEYRKLERQLSNILNKATMNIRSKDIDSLESEVHKIQEIIERMKKLPNFEEPSPSFDDNGRGFLQVVQAFGNNVPDFVVEIYDFVAVILSQPIFENAMAEIESRMPPPIPVADQPEPQPQNNIAEALKRKLSSALDKATTNMYMNDCNFLEANYIQNIQALIEQLKQGEIGSPSPTLAGNIHGFMQAVSTMNTQMREVGAGVPKDIMKINDFVARLVSGIEKGMN